MGSGICYFSASQTARSLSLRFGDRLQKLDRTTALMAAAILINTAMQVSAGNEGYTVADEIASDNYADIWNEALIEHDDLADALLIADGESIEDAIRTAAGILDVASKLR